MTPLRLVATAGMTASVPRDPIQTLVLKVEKEREDALAQAKQFAEENTQLHRVRAHICSGRNRSQCWNISVASVWPALSWPDGIHSSCPSYLTTRNRRWKEQMKSWHTCSES